ncbi:MAG: tRNA (adenosine(37)-N6)-threonylcarbamoyltransferase complex ATPase subunit type 1 TsaE [Defluviitaleaceae bacterium]|nr:tRNA (adenosine(37)-N6)-threonylcarbamoyltransferase complex ATPase subunit type 1 TsaE [Defluviitaleaceae bacterium]
MKITSRGINDTFDFAKDIAAAARPGGVYCLAGPLGSGKTVFAKGFASGLGLRPEKITSPTFALLNIYNGGRLELYHFDLYRLEKAGEFINIGCEDYFYSNGVCLVEWADRAADDMPPDAEWFRFSYGGNENERIIETG